MSDAPASPTEYTPTTDEVREWYAGSVDAYQHETGLPYDAAKSAFDRWLSAHDREVAARALRKAADALAEFAGETYPADVFLKPSEGDYAAINALLNRERGHQLDGVSADCYRRALALAGRLLRERADETGEADG